MDWGLRRNDGTWRLVGTKEGQEECHLAHKMIGCNSVSVWNRVIVLPLCACLLAAGSAQGAENQVLSVGASETERLRDLLSRKRIDAFLADGTHLRGRVKEIQDGFLTVDIKKSTGPNPVMRGLQDIPTDRISTVQFTPVSRPQGKTPYRNNISYWGSRLRSGSRL